MSSEKKENIEQASVDTASGKSPRTASETISGHDAKLASILKSSTKRATIRLSIFGFILLVTIVVVYSIITNPDFLHSALSFRTIETKEGVSKLVGYSRSVSSTQLKLKVLDGHKDELKQKGVKLSQSIESVKTARSKQARRDARMEIVSTILKDHSVYTRAGQLKSLPANQERVKAVIKVVYEPRRYTLDRFSRFSSRIRFSSFRFRYKQQLTVKKLVVTNPEFQKVGKIHLLKISEQIRRQLVEAIVATPGEYKKLVSRYKSSLLAHSKKIATTIEDHNKGMTEANSKMKAVIKRMRSDEYIYASVVLQKVMITMLIVSIGLYFLKAMGTELLFVRKLAIVNICQSIIDGKDSASTEEGIQLYKSLAGVEEKIGDVPNAISTKTLDEVAKILSSRFKK